MGNEGGTRGWGRWVGTRGWGRRVGTEGGYKDMSMRHGQVQ